MCAALELNSRLLRPGRWVGVWRNAAQERLIWAGFARRESLGWWQKTKGGELVDVPAHRFAERSEVDRQLRWGDVPAEQVVRGIIDLSGATPLLKIVTRASSPEEFAHYAHPRMPLLEAPLFSAAPCNELPVEPPSPQGELFQNL